MSDREVAAVAASGDKTIILQQRQQQQYYNNTVGNPSSRALDFQLLLLLYRIYIYIISFIFHFLSDLVGSLGSPIKR